MSVRVCKGGVAQRLARNVVQEWLSRQVHDVAALGDIHGVEGALENIRHLICGDARLQDGGGVVRDDFLFHRDVGIRVVEGVYDLCEGLLGLLLLMEKVDGHRLLSGGVGGGLGGVGRRRGGGRGFTGALLCGTPGKQGQHHCQTQEQRQVSFHLWGPPSDMIE